MFAKSTAEFNDYLDELPDAETCRAREIGNDNNYELVNCLAETPLCKYVLAFGYRQLCRHPRRRDIVKRTQAD